MELKVILVDDCDIVQFFHCEMLKDSNISHSPLQFMNGKEALDYLIDAPIEEIQYLIFLDINMPVLDGFQLLSGIQSLPKLDNLLIVMVTSSTDDADRKRAFSFKQVIDFIEKPFTQKQCEAIKQHELLKGFFQ